MSKYLVCDVCERREIPTSHDVPPKTWYTIHTQSYLTTIHVCSPACLAQYTQEQQPVPETQPAEPQPEPVPAPEPQEAPVPVSDPPPAETPTEAAYA